MKIAYLLTWTGYRKDGVTSKINSQIEEWKREGHEVKLFLVTNEIQKEEEKAFLCESEYYSAQNISNIKNFMFHKLFTTGRLKKGIKEYSPDIIYYRYGTYYPGLSGILKLFPVVCEINTDIEGELKTRSFLLRIYFRLFRRIQFRNCDGIVFMTKEMERKFFNQCIRSTVITNGFKVDEIKIKKRSINKKKSGIDYIMVASASRKWYGLEKIMYLAERLPEHNFHIVGPEPAVCPDNVRMYGYLSHSELEDLYRRMDIGLGVFSLYEINMNEACSLKIREYIAYELPIISGVYDQDIKDSEYVLLLKNSKDNISSSIDKIKEFSLKVVNMKKDFSELKKRIDIRNKERQRCEFFQEVLK